MKTSNLFVLFLASLAVNTQAQVAGTGAAAPALPAPTPYAVVSRDANSATWQRQSVDVGPNGTIVTNVHSYVELATGLNHLVNGQWVPSSENIVIAADGSSAAATNGQHQVYFPGNIYSGDINQVMPDGTTLQSQPVGLSYYDGTNSVLLAVATNSSGAILSSGNQVIYTNAFDGLDADLVYTYTKAGMEQDVVLRQQPPDPSALGLNSASTRLQMLTEFVSAPQPSVTTATVLTVAGNLEDDSLSFGMMAMGQGRAFLLGTNSPLVSVEKRWLRLDGRQFLIEEVPIVSIAQAIDSLPPFVAKAGMGTQPVVSKNLALPPPRLVHATPRTRFLAQAASPRRGLVLDYITMTSQTNYTFRGDSTYYISGTVNLSGANTFEGGAVLKYTNSASLNLSACTQINCLTAPYRPVIFTAKDDNSVGETINGSTGSPSGYYANPAINYAPSVSGSLSLSHFRIAYANEAVYASASTMTVSLQDGQIVDCSTGFYTPGQTSAYLENMLFANVQPLDLYLADVQVENVTFDGNYTALVAPAGSGPNYGVTLNLINCILANFTVFSTVPGISPTGNNNGFYNDYASAFGSPHITSLGNPFKAVGAGDYYLAGNCVFTNQGTTNIDSGLLADLQTKTVFAPTLLTNVIVSVNTNLNPQAQRDTNASPSLGYHFDPIDYLVDQFWVTNAVLTVTNGTAIGGYNDSSGVIIITGGSSINSVGTPFAPNWFVEYSSVQEQPISLGPGGYVAIDPYHAGTTAPNGYFRFTKFAYPGAGGYHLYDAHANFFTYTNLWVQDCEFWGGMSVYGGDSNTVATLINNLFVRSILTTYTSIPASSELLLTNNLFWSVSNVTINPRGAAGWRAYNNAFDSCGTISSGTGGVTNGYNAYLNCTNYLQPTNSTDLFITNTLAYQTSWFGTFYQPTNSPLIHMGSTNANLLGLYHYTVLTNQSIEGTNIVSIGYHYVATDAYGNPLDSNADGIPDYLEDANGNGLFDSGDLGDWQNLNLNVIITRPRNGGILP